MKDIERVNSMQRLIKNRFLEIQSEYAAIANNTAVCLRDIGVSDQPEQVLTQFDLVRQWEIGNVTSEFVLQSLYYMDFNEAAENKLLRSHIRVARNQKDMAAYSYVDTSIDVIKKDLKPKTIKYLEFLKKLFTKMTELEAYQPPVLFAKFEVNAKEPIYTQEVTFDQAHKLIRALELQGGFLLNDHMLIFEKFMHGKMVTHWFLSNKKTAEALAKVLSINIKRGFKTKAEWFEELARQLKVDL